MRGAVCLALASHGLKKALVGNLRPTNMFFLTNTHFSNNTNNNNERNHKGEMGTPFTTSWPSIPAEHHCMMQTPQRKTPAKPGFEPARTSRPFLKGLIKRDYQAHSTDSFGHWEYHHFIVFLHNISSGHNHQQTGIGRLKLL